MDVVVLETWRIVDQWWTKSPVTINYAEVMFMGRKIIFRRIDDTPLWRVVKQ